MAALIQWMLWVCFHNYWALICYVKKTFYFAVSTADFSSFKSLRRDNSGVKLLAAIGGWNEGSLVYSQVWSWFFMLKFLQNIF